MAEKELEKPEISPTSQGSDSTMVGQVQRPDSSDQPSPEESQSKRLWKRWEEGQESNWWFASTGIPLLAATLGPLANISSIAALITSWRQTNLVNGTWVPDFQGVQYADPRWCYWINVASLICGFLGNIFLLLNFTQRIRYIIALPATIILWYLSSGFLIAITACMEIYDPPIRPQDVYTEGFWHGVAAAAFYTIGSMLLMVNMLGFFLGRYPENFALSDSQRTLILQTMAFFIWLGGGAAIFAKIERDDGQNGWGFVDALYFCDVTILTVGFGDLVPSTDLGRGLVFPYSVGGMITLALIVSSLWKAVREIGEEKVFQKHTGHMRHQVLKHTVTNSFELHHRQAWLNHRARGQTVGALIIGPPSHMRPFRHTTDENTHANHTSGFSRMPHVLHRNKKPKILLLKEEKDRFETMRKIQSESKRFRRWIALMWSVTTFAILWCVGAVVFWQAESKAQGGMTYFQSLYFCYVSLLTIGYGDFAPKSNPGRCFFFIWSLIAVPTMTILISDLGDTVVHKFKKWSDELADFTVLPKSGTWRRFLEKHPWLLLWIQKHLEARAAKKRMQHGFDTMDPRSDGVVVDKSPSDRDIEGTADADDDAADLELTRHPTINKLAAEAEQDVIKKPTRASLTRRIALNIRKVSRDLRAPEPKRYSYEEWVEFTRLIRLTSPEHLDHHVGNIFTEDENEEGLVNWDWIGDDSPMASEMSESEWLLERFCESLIRLERRREIASDNDDLTAMRTLEIRGSIVEEAPLQLTLTRKMTGAA